MAKNSEFDVIIAGGGPAGLSALLRCAELGLRAILLEQKRELGGQLLWIHGPILNYLGVEVANGRELRDKFLRQIERLDVEYRTDAEIVEADLTNRTVKLIDGTSYSARAVFIATGVRRRKLNVAGEEEFTGRGILESGVKSREEVRGKTVVIVGGGDAALENAVILSKTASKILVIHRRPAFTARKQFIDQVKTADNVDFIFDTQIVKINGKKCVENVDLMHQISGDCSRIHTDHVLIRVGVEPNTEVFSGQIELDGGEYITIGANCAANIKYIYTGGDVTGLPASTIITAAGHGSLGVATMFEELRRMERTGGRF